MKYRSIARKNIIARLLVISFCSIILVVIGLRWQRNIKLTQNLVKTNPKKFLLEWKAKQNDVLRYKTTQEGRLEISGPMNLIFKHSLETTLQFLIKENLPDKSAIITASFESAKIKIDLPESKTIFYDSSQDKNSTDNNPYNILLKPLMSLVKQQFELKVSSSGQILQSSRLEEIQNNLIREYKTRALAQTALGSSLELYTPEAITHFIESSTFLLPNKQINIGESWEIISREQIPLIGQVAFENNFVLKGPDILNEETCLSLSYHGLPTLESQSETTIFPPNTTKDTKINLEGGNVFGHVFFSPTRGLLLKKTLNLDLLSNVSSKLTGNSIPGFPQSQQVVIPGQEPIVVFKQQYNLQTTIELL